VPKPPETKTTSRLTARFPSSRRNASVDDTDARSCHAPPEDP
jgi:hypothetical protein